MIHPERGGGGGEAACNRHDMQEISYLLCHKYEQDNLEKRHQKHGMEEISYMVCHDPFFMERVERRESGKGRERVGGQGGIVKMFVLCTKSSNLVILSESQ